MENLFMQVFERRDWVTAQMLQQVDSHAQSLAYTLLAAGHRPPPWLLPSFAGEPQELNGKPIVSELLFAGSQITTPATNRTVFQPRAVPSTSFRNVGVPSGYTIVETVCPTLDTNQHEEPQQKQTSDNQELADAVTEVNMFSMVQRSRSRQRGIEDRLREKDQAANSGSSDDGTQDRMQRSKLATVGSNITTASLSCKPCDDGANSAGTRTSLPGQENSFHANQGRSTESLKCSEGGDLGNQGVHLDCCQSLVLENQTVSDLGNQGVHLDCCQSLVLENQTVNSDNNVKVPNNCSVRNLLGVKVIGSVCHPLPVTHLSVEPKTLQFDGVESVCMNPASEQTMQQPGNALESAHPDLAEAHHLNEDLSSTSCSQVPCSMGRSLLDGVESGCLNPDSAPVKQQQQQQQQKSAVECASLDLNGLHSQKEDPSLIISSEVPYSMSGPSPEKDTRCISATNSVEGPCSKLKNCEFAVPEVMSSISARRTNEMYTTERNSMVSAEKCTGNLQQDGTEQATSVIENAVQINANSCIAENDTRMKLSRPSVQYFLCTTASHEKINLLQSDRSSAACDQMRSVGDGVEENTGLSSKRRRIRCQSDISLSRTPCANSLSCNQQVGIAGLMLTATNCSEKSQPSCRYSLRSSGSCESMSLESEGVNAVSNRKMSVASGAYENGTSSRGRRNTTNLSNVVLHNSPNASSRRSAIMERVFENSQEHIENKLEVEFPTTTAASHSCSGILSDNEANCTQEENTCLEGQDLNVTNESVADQEMALQMDNMPSRNVILNPENYSGMDTLSVFPSYTLDQHGEQASAPNALVHGKLCYGSNVELGRKYRSCDPNALLSSAAILRQLDDESVDCNDTMPEFESFDVPVQFDSPTIGQRTFEALYDSRQLVTVSSDPPKKYNINTASGVHQLLTTMSGKPTNCSLPDDLQQYSASIDGSIKDTFGACGYGSFFISDAVASCSSNASNRQEINKTPLTPSVEKYSLGKLSSRSGPGSEHMGSICELECFRIDEDSSIEEEDKYQDRLSGSVDAHYSNKWPSGREALQDITGLCQNNANSTSLSIRCMDTSSIDLTAETFSTELNHHSNIRNDHSINKPKENHSTSVKREGKVSRSLHDRLGRTEVLDSKNGRHMSEANVDRRSKPSNIVANVTSFIPLVKPKLQPTTACVKKDVKVKALKAAEAAKRLEEKKQKEQELRKAAAKLERERLKQEKELKQKLEEEQKKKRDADVAMATRKRQREDVERRETVRKRKCIDEARKQQKPPMDRRRAAKDEKDARRKASDNMELRKNLVDVGKNQVKPEETTEPAFGYNANKSNNDKGVAVDERPASFGSHAKEITPNSLEESYKMSPYKDSDEEDDDDFEHEQESRRRRKFVPSWARKENLDKILLSNKTLDPREIFAQKCSFNISHVLSAHIPQRDFR